MNSKVEQTITECAQASAAGRIHFGEVVATLIGVGVESYHVDYRAGRSTYYLPDGEVLTLETHHSNENVADAFDAPSIKEAIRGAQQGTVMYPEFVRRTKQSGCASYVVWIAGRHVTYFGRRGETHLERFPD